MKKISLVLLITSAILLAGCATTTKSSLSGVERSQFLMLPASSINQMSGQAYKETLEKAKTEKILNTDAAMLKRITTISNRLIAQVGIFRADASLSPPQPPSPQYQDALLFGDTNVLCREKTA